MLSHPKILRHNRLVPTAMGYCGSKQAGTRLWIANCKLSSVVNYHPLILPLSVIFRACKG